MHMLNIDKNLFKKLHLKKAKILKSNGRDRDKERIKKIREESM